MNFETIDFNEYFFVKRNFKARAGKTATAATIAFHDTSLSAFHSRSDSL